VASCVVPTASAIEPKPRVEAGQSSPDLIWLPGWAEKTRPCKSCTEAGAAGSSHTHPRRSRSLQSPISAVALGHRYMSRRSAVDGPNSGSAAEPAGSWAWRLTRSAGRSTVVFATISHRRRCRARLARCPDGSSSVRSGASLTSNGTSASRLFARTDQRRQQRGEPSFDAAARAAQAWFGDDTLTTR